MRVSAFTCVRDESDIVEPFVRHTLAFVSNLYIVDHGSTDGTSEILTALRNEGLPIHVSRDDSLGNHQANRMTSMMIRAARETGADWLLPLDADEFVCWRPGTTLPNSDRPQLLRWRGYVPHESDNVAEPNPVIRIRHRRDIPLWEDSKVLIPRSLANQAGVRLRQGSHGVLLNGAEVPAAEQSCLALAHYPIRSAQQFLAKMVIRALQYELVPDRNPAYGWRSSQILDEALRNSAGVAEQYTREAVRYGLAEATPDEIPLVVDPLDYRGGPMRYAARSDSKLCAFQSLLALAVQMARNVTPPPPAPEAVAAGDRERLLRDQSVALRLLEQRVRELETEVREMADDADRSMHELESTLRSSWTWNIGRRFVGPAAFTRALFQRLRSMAAYSPLIRSINCLSRPRLRRSK